MLKKNSKLHYLMNTILHSKVNQFFMLKSYTFVNMDRNHTIEEKLDNMMRYIHDHPYTMSFEAKAGLIKSSYEDEYIDITNKLVQDNHVRFNMGPSPKLEDKRQVRYLQLTINGRLFLEDGGYIKQKERNSKMFIYTRRAAIWAIIATVISVIGIMISLLTQR